MVFVSSRLWTQTMRYASGCGNRELESLISEADKIYKQDVRTASQNAFFKVLNKQRIERPSTKPQPQPAPAVGVAPNSHSAVNGRLNNSKRVK